MRDRSGAARSIGRGLLAGTVGGLIGAWCMNGIQRISRGMPARTGRDAGKSSRAAPGQSSQRQREPATVQLTRAVVERTFRRSLTAKEKKIADPLMHYGFGAITGAAYGAAAEFAPGVAVGAGLPFGAAVWVAADEITMPALGVSKPPWRNPVSTHAYALASHFVYGLSTELSRRAFRALLRHRTGRLSTRDTRRAGR